MAKRWIAPIVGGDLRLRLLERADLPMTLAWRNQDDIRRWFFTPDVIAPEQHQAWFEQYLERDDDFVFVIEDTETLKRPVGQASLYHIEWAEGRAEFGRLLIGEGQARGRGLAQSAMSLLVDEALERWQLREVYLECRLTNARILSMADACGFHRDGGSEHSALFRRRAAPH